MPDHRMLDDDTFREALNTAVDEIIEAFRMEFAEFSRNQEYLAWHEREANTWFPGLSPWRDESAFDGLPADDMAGLEEHYRNLFKQFRGYNITGGTASIASVLTDEVVERLRLQADEAFEGSRPYDLIKDKLAGWGGGPESASDVFHHTYMPDLLISLVYQYDIAQALKSAIKTHEGVVLAAREGILHIADQTLSALGALRDRRATEGREALQQFVQDAIGAWTGASGEAKAIVTEGLGEIGTAIAGATLEVPDGDVREVVTNMESAIGSLASAIRVEEDLITSTLAGINDLMHGAERMDLPPDVNPPAPVRSPPRGPI
jgi:hypothetical protein